MKGRLLGVYYLLTVTVYSHIVNRCINLFIRYYVMGVIWCVRGIIITRMRRSHDNQQQKTTNA